MRVVIDTNVLVSAALRSRGPERVVMAVVERPEFEGVVSRAILCEFREVLSRPKFSLPQGDGPWFSLVSVVVHACSPHAWGWTVYTPSGSTASLPRPNRAGEDTARLTN